MTDISSINKKKIRDLCDTLTALKWEIREQHPVKHQEIFTQQEWRKLVDERLSEWLLYDMDCIGQIRY